MSGVCITVGGKDLAQGEEGRPESKAAIRKRTSVLIGGHTCP